MRFKKPKIFCMSCLRRIYDIFTWLNLDSLKNISSPSERLFNLPLKNLMQFVWRLMKQIQNRVKNYFCIFKISFWQPAKSAISFNAASGTHLSQQLSFTPTKINCFLFFTDFTDVCFFPLALLMNF